MKRLLLVLFLFGLSLNARADFITGLAVGAVVGSSNNNSNPQTPHSVIVQGNSVVCLLDIQKGTCDYQDPQTRKHVDMTPQEFVEKRVGRRVKIVGTAYTPTRTYYLMQAVFEYKDE
ncbi:hypothetical protein E4H12_01830 [Candidatus Thorarchaeota archaeon]|nr:MAG: hypothetical protein E4H12_01830 [Candidatus Thorarchaeota archaeon]